MTICLKYRQNSNSGGSGKVGRNQGSRVPLAHKTDSQFDSRAKLHDSAEARGPEPHASAIH